jgi:hypothetical protein
MKKYIPKKIFDFIIWQKIKFNNRKSRREKVISEWNNSEKKGLTPHIIKQQIITSYRNLYSIKHLVETGTFRGEMVYALRNKFDKIISVELSEELYTTAKKRLRKFKNIELVQGDSGTVLQNITAGLKDPAIFWLDGHYSGFETAKGELATPVSRELEAILNAKPGHIILIDDARLFNGTNDYPAIDELKKYILSKDSGYTFEVDDDIIRIFKQ